MLTRTRLLKIVLVLMGVLIIAGMTAITQSTQFGTNTHSNVFTVFFCAILYLFPILAGWRWYTRPKTTGIPTGEIRAALQRNQQAQQSRANNL